MLNVKGKIEIKSILRLKKEYVYRPGKKQQKTFRIKCWGRIKYDSF